MKSPKRNHRAYFRPTDNINKTTLKSPRSTAFCFIEKNFTEYKGDDSFLAEPTKKTKSVWSKCEKLLEEENKRGGCLDVETNILSGITAFAPGYIDKKMRLSLDFKPTLHSKEL